MHTYAYEGQNCTPQRGSYWRHGCSYKLIYLRVYNAVHGRGQTQTGKEEQSSRRPSAAAVEKDLTPKAFRVWAEDGSGAMGKEKEEVSAVAGNREAVHRRSFVNRPS